MRVNEEKGASSAKLRRLGGVNQRRRGREGGAAVKFNPWKSPLGGGWRGRERPW